MNIKKISISQLNAATYNPRKDLGPDDAEYKKIERSIKKFGYIDPIIWNEQTGNVVGGHQRLKILAAQGVAEVDVSVVNLSLDEEKTLNITLNKVQGDWDNDKLAELLEELEQLDIDLLLTGFDQSELDKILDNVNFEMGSMDDQGDLSTLEPKIGKTITCPHCLEEFEV